MALDPTRLPEAGLAAARAGATHDELASLADGCRGCDLWANASQVVFGRGPVPAPVVLVGEAPGDREDRAGEPFVGPAGQLLDEALVEAGIDRSAVYVTNAVKHFKWKPSGKRRLHEKPSRIEVAACHPWLEAELELVRPDALLALGATAATALLGPKVKVTQVALTPLESTLAPLVMASLHPSAILRAPDSAARDAGFARLVGDLHYVAQRLGDRVAAASGAGDPRPSAHGAR